jgi:uncharacterized membrane protein YccC
MKSFFTSFFRSEKNIPRASNIIAALLGITAPLALGYATNHIHWGMLSSLGGLVLSGEGKEDTFRRQLSGIAYAMLAGCAAMLAGTAIGEHGAVTAICIPLIAASAGLFGSITRPLARASTVFILFTIIAAHSGNQQTSPFTILILFLTGAVWTAALHLSLRPLFNVSCSDPRAQKDSDEVQKPKYTVRQYLWRWRRTLKTLAGWQYPLRITACLAAAEVYNLLLPNHHGYWASVTIMIVVQRSLSSAVTLTLHRVTGTFIGVLFTSLLLVGTLPVWTIFLIIAILAALRIILRNVNYIAYAAVMTPLVLMLLDFGQSASCSVIIDRLAATLAGGFFALLFGYLVWIRLLPQPQTAVKEKENNLDIL